MLIFRSLLFNVVFYLNLILQMLVQTPVYFLMPRRYSVKIIKNWCRSSNWLYKIITNTNMEVRGQENLLKDGCILAIKHQSMWEFFAILPLIKDPAYVLKRELMWIPLFGWYVAKADMIPVNRGKRSQALKDMTKKARQEICNGRQVLIYPEGTRRTPGAEPHYKYGIAHMYKELDCPVVPVALNSGLYWPRRKLMRFPGTIRVNILPPILPGLETEEFRRQLQNRIETACMDLYRQAAEDMPSPPIPAALRQKLDA